MKPESLIFIFFICLSSLLNAQDTAGIKFLDDFSLKTEIGLTNFESAFKKSNYANSYGFAIIKKIGTHINISSSLNIINIEGKRDLDAAINSYNPYELYEGNGDYFMTKMTEISVIISANIPKVILSLGETFIFPKRINVYLNLGAGLCNFYSIKYNSISNSHIYSYGYNDLNGNFELSKSFWDLPKARLLVYGISVDYKLDQYSNISLSYFIRNTDTPYIDSDKTLAVGDDFRNISLSYITSFKSLKKKLKD